MLLKKIHKPSILQSLKNIRREFIIVIKYVKSRIYTLQTLQKIRNDLYTLYRTKQLNKKEYLFYIKPIDSAIDTLEVQALVRRCAGN
jgi:hypothetical protein